jgi:alcohol dehydrogenase YqhD (iron-dependent ADH family)
MDLSFEFTAPTRVIFGSGTLSKVPQLIGGKKKEFCWLPAKTLIVQQPIG